MLLYKDNREAKRELIELIKTPPDNVQDFHNSCMEILRRHKVQIKGAQYSYHLTKLVVAQNTDRAIKLVNAITDEELRNEVRVIGIALLIIGSITLSSIL